jgi:hypothetical protein
MMMIKAVLLDPVLAFFGVFVVPTLLEAGFGLPVRDS